MLFLKNIKKMQVTKRRKSLKYYFFDKYRWIRHMLPVRSYSKTQTKMTTFIKAKIEKSDRQLDITT